jgi:uncharacterized membrane protein
MRRLLCGLVIVWLVGIAGWAHAEVLTPEELRHMDAGYVVTHEHPVKEGASICAHVVLKAPLACARQVLWDHAKFPEFMPGARSVRILASQDDCQVIEQIGGYGPWQMVLVTKRCLKPDRVVWQAVRGDLRRNDGEWVFQAVPGGIRLTYAVQVVPPGPVPPAVVAFLQKQALHGLIDAVRKRILACAAAAN